MPTRLQLDQNNICESDSFTTPYSNSVKQLLSQTVSNLEFTP